MRARKEQFPFYLVVCYDPWTEADRHDHEPPDVRAIVRGRRGCGSRWPRRQRNTRPGVRHTAVWIEQSTLYLLYTIVGDAPESIMLATIDLSGDWMRWKVSSPQLLLKPEKDWEGANLPVKASKYGAARGPVNALGDPCVFEEEGKRYLLYSVAGEQGIGIARLVAA